MLVPDMETGLKFGEMDFIGYTSVPRDGKREKYIHEFKKSSRPTLVANHDGNFVQMVGGRYRFTDAGFEDY